MLETRPWIAYLLLAGLVVVLSACSPSRLVEAVDVLEDLQAYDQPSSLKEATPEPLRAVVNLDDGNATQHGHLYLTQDTAGGSIVLVPGVTPRGLNDPRVIAFAKTLARARFDVLVPDLVNMWSQRIDAADADTVAAWLAYLERRAPNRPVGVVGVSFGAGPALIGLFRPGGEVTDFALTIGGYYDIDGLITYVTTGGYRNTEADPWSFAPPDRRAKWVFARTNAARINDPKDRLLIDAIAQRKLDDADADVTDLTTELGAEGQGVYDLLINADPDATPRLIEALAPGLQNAIRQLDVRAYDLADHPAEFFVVHDIQDRVIPASESVKMASAAATEPRLIGGLDHANLEEPSIGDAIAMLRVVYRILGFRNEAPSKTNAAASAVALKPQTRYVIAN